MQPFAASRDLLAVLIVFGVIATGCDPASEGPKSPDEIPDTPAELVFDELVVEVGDDVASWAASSSPSLVVSSGGGISCDDLFGFPLTGEEIGLSVAVPIDAQAGDVYELPSSAPPGEGARASIGIEGNVSFSFGQGMIVVDERTDERVAIRLDVSSPDGTKRARGAVSAPFCP